MPGEDAMKMRLAVLAMMPTALLMLPANDNAQTLQKSTAFTIAGHAGEVQLVQINGKSYVEVESLARLTHGNLSFKANRTILTLPSSDPEPPATAIQAQST